MELYTSLVRLKQAMNGGQLPAMTEIPEPARLVLDPEFTIGLGALTEDAEKGLRCPVRGCGTFRHVLSRHLDSTHADVGGVERVRELLDIPRSVRLVSTHYSDMKRAELAPRIASGELQRSLIAARASRPGALKDRTRANVTLRRVYRMAGARNLQNRCEAQMRHALIDLQNKIGRAPSRADADAELGTGFSGQVIAVYGSWNAAKAQFGLEQYQRGHRVEITREAVIEALSAYHRVHGCLPNAKQALDPTRTPLIPSRPTIQKAMGTTRWVEAMQRAASILNIYGGRYGLPVRPLQEAVA